MNDNSDVTSLFWLDFIRRSTNLSRACTEGKEEVEFKLYVFLNDIISPFSGQESHG